VARTRNGGLHRPLHSLDMSPTRSADVVLQTLIIAS
jgi:hypothetical protein